MNTADDLTSKLLRADHGIFYLPENNIELPKEVHINGTKYSRFCDFILIPGTIDMLSQEQVVTANNIRLKYIESQAQFQTNLLVRKYFQRIVEVLSPKRMLEFGPGTNPLILAPTGSIQKIFLADFSQSAIDELKRHEIPCHLFPVDGTLEIQDNMVDLVIAIFVLQFDVSIKQIQELHRVLSEQGVFVANVYKRSESSRLILLQHLKQKGFNAIRLPDPHNLCDTHEYFLLCKGPIKERTQESVANIISSKID